MKNYQLTVTVQAQQFLPEEDSIPEGVTSDGPRSPQVDPRAQWMISTVNGTEYIQSGKWVVKGVSGYFLMTDEQFKNTYTESQPSG